MFALLALLPTLALAHPTSTNQKRYSGVTIQSYRTGGCLSTQPGVQYQDGTLLYSEDCSTATLWDINPGSGSVLIHGTNWALDAGINPSNNVPAKIWTSYPGITQQTWYLTNDNRIAITGGNQCLDEGPNGPQTYQCTTGNTNQVWYVGGVTPPPASSSSSASSTPTGPVGPVSTIQWQGTSGLCATLNGPLANGSPVVMAPCGNPYGNDIHKQLWFLYDNGPIQFADQSGGNFCLDAGINPSNGVSLKIWQCYQGLSQQTWNFDNGNLISTANNQCLDVNNANTAQLQTWACSSPDPQQQFITN